MWDEITYPFLIVNGWSLGMDKESHPTFYLACDYLTMLWLKINHFSKRGPCGLRVGPYTNTTVSS